VAETEEPRPATAEELLAAAARAAAAAPGAWVDPDPPDWPVVTVPESHWRDSYADGEPREAWKYLTAAVRLNGVPMHLEAYAIEVGPDGVQTALVLDERFCELANAVAADGHFQTHTIRGREYAVFASPFC
jgi:hypothetical protein